MQICFVKSAGRWVVAEILGRNCSPGRDEENVTPFVSFVWLRIGFVLYFFVSRGVRPGGRAGWGAAMGSFGAARRKGGGGFVWHGLAVMALGPDRNPD